MTESDRFDSQKLVTLVGYFATPFALFLGGLAVAFSETDSWGKSFSLGLLGFAAFFNVVFPRFLRQQDVVKKSWNVKFRLYMNLIVNSVVIFLLGDKFQPLWLLLALTPFATAIYGNQRRTLTNAITASVILFLIQALRSGGTSADWAVVSVEVAFIVLISLLINGVANMAGHPEKSVQMPHVG
ncbi:MAG: hypothetical protein JNK54_04455 [Elusimicrobia bacterium]|jgi:hypothetical protein|nr:hypothetical protein [Elusimicrobiota bacterium]